MGEVNPHLVDSPVTEEEASPTGAVDVVGGGEETPVADAPAPATAAGQNQ